MKIIVVVLLVLVLTLDIRGAAASEATVEEKKADEAKCKAKWVKTLETAICKESCDLLLHFKTVVAKEAECSRKCSEPQPGPATKPCQEGCKKEYEAQVPEITAKCNAICGKVDKVKNPVNFETCKKNCSPDLILKSLGAAVEQAFKE